MGLRRRAQYILTKKLYRLRKNEMKLSYIFGMLASGELANLNLAEDHINIKPDRQVAVLRAINAGLMDLHTRFLLKRGRAEMPVVLSTDEFTITEPNFIELIDVYHNNRLLKDKSYTMMSPNAFRFRNKLGVLDSISVEYKAGHKVLEELDISLDTEVNLPPSYLNALLYFVAMRFYTGAVNQLDGDLNEGITYARKYQEEIMLLSNQGIDADSLVIPNSFHSRGFM